MSANTKIEWATKTWNPLRGCSKVSEGCRNCYAIRVANRFGGPGKPFEGLTTKGAGGLNWTGKIQLVPEVLDEPLRWRKPERVFVNSMSDLFHDEVPELFIRKVFQVMGAAEKHTFMVLTKRPDRMQKVIQSLIDEDDFATLYGEDKPLPYRNVLLGVSVENQKAADERIPLLLKTPAAVRFLSCEPLLGAVNIRGYLMQGKDPGKCANCGKGHGFDRCPNYGGIAKTDDRTGCNDFQRQNFAIDWVIVGGESGPGARPMHPEWARSMRDQCQAAGVAFFFKQWGEWAPVHELRCNEPGIKGRKWFNFDPDTALCRIGKQAAGRMLDGRTWDEFPEAQHGRI